MGEGRKASSLKPQAYGVLSQKDDTFSLSYTDANHHLHTLTVPVNESSYQNDTDAHHYYTGDYKLVGLKHNENEGSPFQAMFEKDHPLTPEAYRAKGGHFSESDFVEGSPKDRHAYGWATTHFLLVNSPVSNQLGTIPKGEFYEPKIDEVSRKLIGGQDLHNGIDFHGGGTKLANHGGLDTELQPYQPLVAAAACVRMHNIDAYILAEMTQHEDIPVRVSHSPTVMHSINGKDWKPMELGETHTGPLTIDVDKNGKHIVTQHLAHSTHTIRYQLDDLKAIGFNPHQYHENDPVTIETTQASIQSLSVAHHQHNTTLIDLQGRKQTANHPAPHPNNVEASTENVPYPTPRAGTAPPQLVSNQTEEHPQAHHSQHGRHSHHSFAKAHGHAQSDGARGRSPWVDRVLARTAEAIKEGAQRGREMSRQHADEYATAVHHLAPIAGTQHENTYGMKLQVGVGDRHYTARVGTTFAGRISEVTPNMIALSTPQGTYMFDRNALKEYLPKGHDASEAFKLGHSLSVEVRENYAKLGIDDRAEQARANMQMQRVASHDIGFSR